MTHESVRSNESFFDHARQSVIHSAPDDARYVVIANESVVDYYTDFGSAIDAWGQLEDALVIPLVQRDPALVASNFVAH